jgi:hypothetical protein
MNAWALNVDAGDVAFDSTRQILLSIKRLTDV